MFGKDKSLTYKRTQLEHSGIRKRSGKARAGAFQLAHISP